MDRESLLEAFDQQIRRHADRVGSVEIERTDTVVRCVPASDGWAGVTWSDLDSGTADAVIAEQISRFAGLAGPWEWKHYSYDQPPDLAQRLIRAGFVRESEETVLVAEIKRLALDVSPPTGVELRAVTDHAVVQALVDVHDEVFGGDHAAVGRSLLAGLASRPATAAAVVAWDRSAPVGAGRVELHHGTDFASLWGGGTVESWRRRGVFRSMVAERAAIASAHGFRYLQVDASPDSRPILQRLGFVELATTTPFTRSVSETPVR
jgi:ribosomal protein S18 acetylase RimI-like enzyme